MRSVLRILMATLREIFDESAYERFLNRNSEMPSRESYAAFLAESKTARSGKPRCC